MVNEIQPHPVTGRTDADLSVSTTPAPQDGDKRSDRRGAGSSSWTTSLLSKLALIFVLLVLVGVFSALRPNTFPTIGNLKTITSTQSVLIVVSLGLLFPLAVGEFDLSFGAILGLSSSTLAYLTVNQHWSFLAALAVVFGAAVAIGFVNAFFVVILGVNSFIVTLGMSSVLVGLTLRITNSSVIAGGAARARGAFNRNIFGAAVYVLFWSWVGAAGVVRPATYTAWTLYLLRR